MSIKGNIGQPPHRERAVSDLSDAQASEALAWLATQLGAANVAYHRDDQPEIDDADYDALKKWNREIETAFPHLKRADSPTE